jgi:hypothetical protein
MDYVSATDITKTKVFVMTFVAYYYIVRSTYTEQTQGGCEVCTAKTT